MADNDKFAPAFAMPVIAPAPDNYTGDTVAYYAAVAAQSVLAFTDVLIPPEAALPPDPQSTVTTGPEPKGLTITIPNPAGSIAESVPFGTLFALMGGWLTYARAAPDPAAGSAVDLAPILVPPFDGVTPAPLYPAPAGIDPAKPWGAFVLRLWAMDLQKLAEAMAQSPTCAAVYYLGVDEASAKTALEPMVKLHFREDHYDQSVADSTKPVFQDVVEEIKGQPYTTTPAPYADLVSDFLTALMNGATSLLVKGGTPIGEAVQVIDSAAIPPTPSSVGRIELWFLDKSKPPQFISPTQLIKGASTYDF